MKRMFVKCPVCEAEHEGRGCPLSTAQRAEGDKIYIYCCEPMEKKDERG